MCVRNGIVQLSQMMYVLIDGMFGRIHSKTITCEKTDAPQFLSYIYYNTQFQQK